VKIQVPRWRLRSGLWLLNAYAFACKVTRHIPSREEERWILGAINEFIVKGSRVR